MIKYIIFDLSEVLISGIIGIEHDLENKIDLSKDKIVKCFSGDLLQEFMKGNIDEEIYLSEIIRREKWSFRTDELKSVIRKNFHNPIDGMLPIVQFLSGKYKLVLLSDHSKEWIEYIKSIHPFLNLFEKLFFSYELKATKRDPETFRKVINLLECLPEECLFIDDHSRNTINAIAVGMNAIQFNNPALLIVELENRLGLNIELN